MGRKKGSVFHLLWRLLWDSGGAMGAELCDVTACRAQPLTNGLWQGQLTKARARAWILRTLAFFFFFPLFAFRKAVVRQLFDAKQTDILRGPRGERREMNVGASPPPGPASLPRRHTREAWRPCPSLLPPFGAGGPSPTSEEAARRATCAALASRPCLISPWYLRGSSL